MDTQAWRAAVHRITKSRTWLSDWTELIFNFTKGGFDLWNLRIPNPGFSVPIFIRYICLGHQFLDILRFLILSLKLRLTISKCASLVAQLVKNLPAMRETWVRSLGWEDSLEKNMATHSSILAWKIPWTQELGRPQCMASQSRTWLSDWAHTHKYT